MCALLKVKLWKQQIFLLGSHFLFLIAKNFPDLIFMLIRLHLNSWSVCSESFTSYRNCNSMFFFEMLLHNLVMLLNELLFALNLQGSASDKTPENVNSVSSEEEGMGPAWRATTRNPHHSISPPASKQLSSASSP